MSKYFSFLEDCIRLSVIAFLILYLPRLRCWIAPIKKQKRVISNKENKLALIIPARNESMAIGALFSSIGKQTYPKENFDFFVLVKDKDDKTIEMTEKVGGIIQIIEGQTCKGDALDASMQQILKETRDKYDAFIVVDADCVLEEHFMEEMNNAMASGRKVINSKKIVKNYLSSSKNANSIWSACNGLIWTIMDDLGNRYKSDNDITTMTIGTGLLICTDFIKELGGWPYRETLTEDIELMYDCMCRDIGTFYYSYAVLYVEESTSLKVTNKRRNRWLTGVVDSKKIYNKRIRSKCRTQKGIVNYYYTTALTAVYYFIGFLTAVFCVNLPFSALLFLCSNDWWLTAFAISAECFLIVYAAFFALTVACLIIDSKTMKISWYKKLLVLIVHPVFYMGYIPIIARAIFSNSNRGWEVIDRMEFDDEETAEGADINDKTASAGKNI